MKELTGKTSDRIRSGDIPADALNKVRAQADETPSMAAVRAAEGHGLGQGATGARNGGS